MTKDSNTPRYYAVLRYHDHVPGYAGIMTWTGAASKAEFDEWHNAQGDQEVVEEGISAERCIELTRKTPAGAYVEAAYFAATNPQTGDINDELLAFQLEKAEFAIDLTRR